MPEVDPFSVKSVYLETYLDEQKGGVATGFIVKKDNSNYLITNWHVVTARDPVDNRPISRKGIVDPNMLRVWFHGERLGSWIQVEVPILGKKQEKLWFEHCRGREIDVVAVPLEILEHVKYYHIDLALADFDLMLYPSEPVSIIGFPEGLTSAGRFAIWKTV